jgi:hypothetical protein
MITKAAATRCNSIRAAVAVAALGATLIGCANPSALMYAHEAHAREVGAWCHAFSRPPTAALQEDCVQRAWANIPHSRYWIEHHSKVAPCQCGGSRVYAQAALQEPVTPPVETAKPPQ